MATGTSFNDREYLFRLQTLIIDGGTDVLRNIFDQKVQLQNVSLNVFLANEKTLINRLRAQKTITKTQYHQLYPPGGQQPNSADFDITLIICLLRNLPSLGLNRNYSWNVLPQPADTSVEADLCRLKGFRNEVAHISSTTGFQQTAFLQKWTEIEQVLLRLNQAVSNPIPNLTQTIDSFKNSSLDPVAEKRIQAEIKQWRKMEKGLETEMQLIKDSVRELKEGIEGMVEDVKIVEKHVGGVKENVEYMKQDVKNVDGKFIVVKEDIGAVKKNVEIVTEDIDTVKAHIGEVKGCVKEVNVNVKDGFVEVKEDIGEVKRDLKKINAVTEDVRGDLGEVKQNVEEVMGHVKKLTEDVKKTEELQREQKGTNEANLSKVVPDTKVQKKPGILRRVYEKIVKSRRRKDKLSWTDVIEHKDQKKADALLKQGILPFNDELIQTCHAFGRTSATFSNICCKVYEKIKHESRNVVDTWASYRFEDSDEQDTITTIVFVVFTKDSSTELDIIDYNIVVRCVTAFSEESQIVQKNELLNNTANIPDEQKILSKLRNCISNQADALMDKHSNVSVILPSLKRSVGYGSADHRILNEPCIAVYVNVKGRIPIQEDPFPRKIEGYYIDVLEDEFVPFTGRANDFHTKLKMGLAIHANIVDENGDRLAGTLGGFIDHQIHGLCGITCAHVVSRSDELFKREMFCPDDRHVFQPVSDESQPFGKIVRVISHEGSESSPGMEVALFQIHNRHPENGSFPDAFNNIDAGFDDDNPLTYNSGKTREAAEIRRRTEVYKFGMASGITRGSFGLQGAVVRKKEIMEGQRNGLGYRLKNQMLILQIGENPFAENGDSGALVLTEGEHTDSVAIGLVEGGIRGRVFVTPICDIIRALGCSYIGLKQFSINCNHMRSQESAPTDSGVIRQYDRMEVGDMSQTNKKTIKK